ncbi:hypothetical protein PPL_01388 [Heterostelium album PN500]|uniref:SIS domain-containing protein n=1 Tax=Heterostelium pallidum (strain ATCC 26659 / Pp 5 / PN500) TaxID=670386 RepID=D3AZ48_HETP5|nr:hypothetical protein PPL_01388 [Heterostelium album PN500]EFA85605.1 hypothetical protein PPL_01388 [Heterostelium album PN500]|eukprot:XP_020437712.1 hypothetical protein PPL_01388 [Heterostelium album PN500]
MEANNNNKNEHPYYMYDMIQGTPTALRRVYTEELTKLETLATELYSTKYKSIHLVGSGSSWHTVLNTQYFLESIGGCGISDSDAKRVVAWNSLDFLQKQPKLDESAAVILFSHLGGKKYTNAAIRIAKKAKSYVVLVTSLDSILTSSTVPVQGVENDTLLIDSIDVIIGTSHADKSMAFTVTHTCANYVTFILAVKLGLKNKNETAILLDTENLAKVPEYFECVIADETPYKKWAVSVQDCSYLPFVGYTANIGNCYEAGLRIKRAAHVIAEGYQLEQFIHSSFPAIDKKTSLTAIITPDIYGVERSIEILKVAKHVGAKVSIITTKDDSKVDSLVGVDNIIKLVNVPEAITVFTNLGCLQLLTYHLSLVRNTNPDTNRTDQPLYCDAYRVCRLANK